MKKEIVILRFQSASLSFAADLLKYANTWLQKNGWTNAKLKSNDDERSYEIIATPTEWEE